MPGKLPKISGRYVQNRSYIYIPNCAYYRDAFFGTPPSEIVQNIKKSLALKSEILIKYKIEHIYHKFGGGYLA